MLRLPRWLWQARAGTVEAHAPPSLRPPAPRTQGARVHAARGPRRRGRHRGDRPRIRRQLDVPGLAQAGGAVLPGEPRAFQASHADLARVPAPLRRARHGGHDCRLPRCAGPGGGRGQPGRPHLLALADDAAASRCLSPGVERGGYVSDDGCDLRRSAALLHSRPCRRRGWTVARVAILLVQRHVYARAAEPRRRDDLGVSRSPRHRNPRAPSPRGGDAAAEAGSGRGDPPLRRGRRIRVCQAQLPPDRRPALRRARRGRATLSR